MESMLPVARDRCFIRGHPILESVNVETFSQPAHRISNVFDDPYA